MLLLCLYTQLCNMSIVFTLMYLCKACVQLFSLSIREQVDSKHSLSCPPKPYAICDMANAIYSRMSLSSEDNI